MRILHLCLSASYIEGLSYQENLLPQYHIKMGFEVFVLSSLKTFSKDGEYIYEKKPKEYINEFGVHVKQLPYCRPLFFGKIFKKYKDTYNAIDLIAPDIIFMHGVQSVENKTVAKYIKKHKNVKLFADNHSDFSNSATNWISKNIQHKIIWRHYVKKIQPYVVKFWGVTPARVDFLINLYKIPKEKVDLLVMGADDEFATKYSSKESKQHFREKLGFKKNDFVVVTGGKIDQWKTQTLLLMDAVNKSQITNIKLLIFGTVVPEIRDIFLAKCSNKIKFIGWANNEESYQCFASGDIVCFPGRHSVYWEQVAGQGIPIICKYWNGTTHISNSGNCIFLFNDSVEDISNAINESYKTIDSMSKAAKKDADLFLYSKIARKSIFYE